MIPSHIFSSLSLTIFEQSTESTTIFSVKSFVYEILKTKKIIPCLAFMGDKNFIPLENLKYTYTKFEMFWKLFNFNFCQITYLREIHNGDKTTVPSGHRDEKCT